MYKTLSQNGNVVISVSGYRPGVYFVRVTDIKTGVCVAEKW